MLTEQNVTQQPVVVGNNSENTNFYASRYNRQILRANSMLEVLGSGLSELSLAAIIPTKMAQTAFSGLGLFSTKLKPRERIGHGILASLALTQMLCVIAIYYKGNECQIHDEALCRLLMISSLLYQGADLAHWIHAETFRHLDNQPVAEEESEVSANDSMDDEENHSTLEQV